MNANGIRCKMFVLQIYQMNDGEVTCMVNT